MKIVYVLDSLTPGGTETSTVTLASQLVSSGVQCHVIVLKDALHSLESEAVGQGITVERLSSRSLLAQVRELRTRLRELSPHVLHTALFRADQVGRLAAIGLGIPVVSGLVGTPYDPARLADPNLNRWKLTAVRMVDSITARLFVDRFAAVSDGVKEANSRALRVPLDRISVVERGRDPERYRPVGEQRRLEIRKSLGISAADVVVLNVGRLDHHKSQVDLVHAASELIREIGSLVVLIAGKGGNASVAVTEAIASDERLVSAVRLIGHREDVPDLLNAADLLVIASRVEGTAGVALEAMATRTPILSTDLAGLRGVLRPDENAVVVAVGDPSELANGIRRIVEESGLRDRLVRAGASTFSARFTIDAASEQLLNFYRQLIVEPKRSAAR